MYCYTFISMGHSLLFISQIHAQNNKKEHIESRFNENIGTVKLVLDTITKETILSSSNLMEKAQLPVVNDEYEYLSTRGKTVNKAKQQLSKLASKVKGKKDRLLALGQNPQVQKWVGKAKVEAKGLKKKLSTKKGVK